MHEVDEDLLQWGEAVRITGLLAGTKGLDKEAVQEVVFGVDKIRERIHQQREGLKLQDEGLAVVEAAVKYNPVMALGPLLDALMADNKATHLSGDGHVAKCKATVPVH